MKRRRSQLWIALASVLVMGKACDVDVTDPDVAATVAEINAMWRQSYRQALRQSAMRDYPLNRAAAANAMRQAMEGLGLSVVSSEGDYYLSMTGPAPLPLDEAEWQRVRGEEEPAARKVVARHMGALKANFFTLQPQGLNSDLTFTFLETEGGVRIYMTYRSREINPPPPESILPRRDYPPPSAVRMGVDKIWRLFEAVALGGNQPDQG